MNKIFAMAFVAIPAMTLVLTWLSLTAVFAAGQTWTGTISDSMCGASHQTRAGSGNMTDRQCAIECIKALASYVLIDDNKKVIPIANQDFVGLPLRAGRRVKVTGELKENAIVLSRIESLASGN